MWRFGVVLWWLDVLKRDKATACYKTWSKMAFPILKERLSNH